jgi:hypothetical protein
MTIAEIGVIDRLYKRFSKVCHKGIILYTFYDTFWMVLPDKGGV